MSSDDDGEVYADWDNGKLPPVKGTKGVVVKTAVAVLEVMWV